MEFKRKPDSRKQMVVREENGVCYLQFEIFSGSGVVRHMFTTRIGGVSDGYLGTMNLSYTRGDKKDNVDENFRRISEIMECKLDDFVLSDQTHTDNIRIVTDEDRGKGLTRSKDYTDVDGLITNKKGIVLSAFFADCVPLYFLDPVKEVIGLSHSGWKGTVKKIGKKTVELMKQEFGCKNTDIIAAIGPSICKECYEVSEDVVEEFRKSFKENRLDDIIYPKDNGKSMLDLWQANKEVLLEAGIKSDNICVTDICTSCNKELLFSHRASNGLRGNLGAFIMLI